MIDVSIRTATRDDLTAVGEVFRPAALANDGDRESLLAHPDALLVPEAPLAEGRTRVAVVDGRIVGFATTAAAGRVGELEDLFVDSDWMRRGIGRMLVRDAIGGARTQGLSRIELTANSHAREFYERVGFVPAGLTETRFGTALRMRLAVPRGPTTPRRADDCSTGDTLDPSSGS